MFKKYLLVLFIFHGIHAVSQQVPDFGSVNSHEYYVSQLEHSKDQNFQEIISSYHTYIQNNPNDVAAQIELCKFIGNSYWDEYEDYNLTV